MKHTERREFLKKAKNLWISAVFGLPFGEGEKRISFILDLFFSYETYVEYMEHNIHNRKHIEHNHKRIIHKEHNHKHNIIIHKEHNKNDHANGQKNQENKSQNSEKYIIPKLNIISSYIQRWFFKHDKIILSELNVLSFSMIYWKMDLFNNFIKKLKLRQ